MLTDKGEIRLDPVVVHVDDLLDEVARGLLRVPDFQRPFVWRPEQMLDLFDSIERGYPIGSLLLWQTEMPMQAVDQIGGISVPTDATGGLVSYVLDGHQRLSTIFGVLGRQEKETRPDDPRDWRWWIYRDLRERSGPDRYRHHRSGHPAPDHFLPLRAVSKTMDFLDFSRALELRVKGRDRVAALVREAEAVAQRIKSYKLTLIRLQGANLDQAVEVYTRLNRTGTRMDADQMVSALTHRSGRPTLASRIDDIVDAVAATGFGEIPRLAVFRVVLAVADEPDVMSPRWEAVAFRLQDKLYDAVPAADRAVRGAVDFLRLVVGVPLARFLPYAHQLVLLAVFFWRCPYPTDEQLYELRRWFWVTSWASSFAGANSTMLRRALQEMTDFAAGAGELTLDVAGVQPMPDAFNLNSARTRAYLAWELHELPSRLDSMGQEIDLIKLVASAESQVFRPVVAGDKRPANRLVLPTRPDTSVLAALKELDPAEAPEILESHGISVKSWRRLCEGGRGAKIFVDDRTEFLERRLRAFAAEIGVPLGDNLEGIAEDDTE